MLFKRSLFGLFAFLSILVGLYPIIYLLIDRHFGLLGNKSAVLLSNMTWNVGFYLHIFTGGLALLIGWSQFVGRWRRERTSAHRFVGKIYVLAALTSGVSGLGIAFAATGGLSCQIGFMLSALLWLTSTIGAFLAIRKGKIRRHQQWMMLSYALCFSAVTLRIWLPLFTIGFGDFISAYQVVAWVSWVPNVIAAYFLAKSVPSISLSRSRG